jgi:hypothetical protein
MGLATLANLPVTPELVAQFAFANMDSHRKIAGAVFAAMGQIIPLYPLDPIPLFPGGLLTWARNHQSTHDVQNAILGIRGDDLTSVDFTNEEQLSAWIFEHFAEHYAAETQLGI